MKTPQVMFYIIFLAFVFYFLNVKCLKVIPQKAVVTYQNDKYIKWCNLTIKRYGRKSDYYLNIEGAKHHTWDNNVTYHLIFYEYLHNEYRRSFVEIRFKVCDLINKDPYIGRMFAEAGITCPVVAKEFHLMNLTVPATSFPYVFPFERARIDTNLTVTDTGESIARAEVFTIFKK